MPRHSEPCSPGNQVVEYAGYHRAIIHRNPPVLDDEGYELDSDDQDERVQEAMTAAADANPYSSICIERMFITPASLRRTTLTDR
jgi:hypothetical protein